MKKIILIAFIGTLFATGTAFAHCGSCGVGDKAKDHAHEMAKDCKKDCAKACCAKDKAECKEACAKAKAECKAACEKKCKEGCTKPCCAKDKAAEPTANVDKPAGACCAAKAGNPA